MDSLYFSRNIKLDGVADTVFFCILYCFIDDSKMQVFIIADFDTIELDPRVSLIRSSSAASIMFSMRFRRWVLALCSVVSFMIALKMKGIHCVLMIFYSHLHSQLAVLMIREGCVRKQPFFMCQHAQLRGSFEWTSYSTLGFITE